MTEWGKLIRQMRAKGGVLGKEESRRLDEARVAEASRRLHSLRALRQRLSLTNLVNALKSLNPLDRNRE